MKITLELIMSYKPCKSGLENLNKHYPKYEGELTDFLTLKHVPYNDKIWLATKVCNIKDLQKWSIECAEFVLPNYESQFPNDSRIRDCLEVTKKFITGTATIGELLVAMSAARSAAMSAAWSAGSAGSAAWSAWSAAESAELAAELAAESAAMSAAWSAAWSAAKDEQETNNLGILISILKNK